jgi:RHS repeat-associated protein
MRYRTLRFFSLITLAIFIWTFGGFFDIAHAMQTAAKTSSGADLNYRHIAAAAHSQKTVQVAQQRAENKQSPEPWTLSGIRGKKAFVGADGASFDETEKRLIAAGASKEKLERHRQFVRQYGAGSGRTKAGFSGIKTSKRHKALDPNKLSHRTPQAQKKEPRTKPEEFLKNSVHNPEAALLAGTITQAAPLPTEADLAETIEVKFTTAIRAKAAELGANPVKIYNWVRNNIEYAPTYGSIQGADYCLQTKQCNAFDTSSLLIALLRASNIHARYVYGTIELPIDKAMNWAGGFTDRNAAVEYIASGGVPVSGITSGGEITAVKMEHVWVEAYINYNPSRGAKHQAGKGDTWIQLDGSYKQYDYTPRVDISTAVPFDSQAFVSQIQSTAVIDSANSSVTGVGCAPLSQMMSSYKEQLKSYLEQQYPSATLGAVLGDRAIVQQDYPYLLGTLPYSNVVIGERLSDLTDNFRHKVEITLRNGTDTDISIQKGMPEIAGRKITLGYIPATAADAAVINAYLPQAHADGSPINYSELPASLPAYLINLRAELRIDGVVAATGNSTGMGWERTINIAVSDANQNIEQFPENIYVGEFSAITVNTGKIAESEIEALKNRLNATAANLAGNTAGITREDVSGDLLYGTGLAYFAEIDKLSAVRAKIMGVIGARLPSVALTTSGLQMSYVQGAPNMAMSGGVSLDVPTKAYIAAAADGNKNTKLRYAFITGLDASSLTDIVMDRLIAPATDPQAVSAVKALGAAKNQGIPIHTVDQTNISIVLPQLQISDEIKTDISNAVSVGETVVAAKTDVTLNGWTGAAYLITDKTSGDGAYNITGGINGAVLLNLPWIGNSVINSVVTDVGAPLNQLALQMVNDNTVKAAEAVERGVSDLTQSAALTYIDTIVSSIVYDSISAELGCYINTGGAAAICPAIYLGALCVAQETSPIESENTRPVANAGADRSVKVGASVILSGSASYDAEKDPLTYVWTFLSIPSGSKAQLSGPTSVTPSFTADLSGAYRVQLVVSDGKSVSDPATVTITATDATVTVPDVVGLTQAAAEERIAQAGLTIGSITQTSSGTVPAGNVISQTPAAGTSVYKDSAVGMVVSAGAADIEAPTLTVVFDRAPPVYTAGEQALVTINAQDASGNVTVTMLLDGANVPVTLPTTTIDTTGFVPGSKHEVVVTATNPASKSTTVPESFGIKDPNDTALPDVVIISPVTNSEISQVTTITGNAKDAALMEYTLAYSSVGKNQFTVFARGTTAVDNGPLGALDPTLMKNGLYDILLTATDTSGKTKTHMVTYRLTGEMKVGNFTVSFTDLSVPVSGIPVTVTRTYDSRNKAKGDFGIGWTIDIQSIKIEESQVPGSNWNMVNSGGGMFPNYCFQGSGEHYVSITLPDGKVEEFDMGITPACQQLVPIEYPTAVTYTARVGTSSTLKANGYGQLYYNNGILYDYDLLDVYNPSSYTLTTADGVVYALDESFGVRTITDTNGNVVTYSASGIVHSRGKSIAFARDAENRITQITDPLGGTISYEYDTSGDLASVTDQLGNKTTYTYNSEHGLTDIKDPRGITPIKNIYDDSGRLVAHIDAHGNRIEYTHNIAGKQTIVKDRNGNQTVFIYDSKGRVLSKTDPLGNTTEYTYDANGNKLSERDPNGNLTQWTYDSKNNKLSETKTVNGNVVTTTWTYNALSKPLTTTDAMGNVTTNTYDARGNLLTTTDPLGNTTTNTYNAAGNVLTTADALGNVTAYEYDAYGNRTKQTDPAGNVTTNTYDASGNRLTETDARGGVTAYAYDAKGNILATTDSLGNVTKTEYDKAGNRVSSIDALGVKTTFVYNSVNKLIQTNYADGATVKAAYDAEGNRVSSTNQLGIATGYEYDSNKNLVKVTYPDGATQSFGYDSSGRQTTVTDASGNVTSREYDSLGHVVKTTDAEGNATTFEFDLNGNQTKQTDANGVVTTFEYNAKGQLIKTTLASGQTTSVAYDALGRKTSETDAAGNTTTFAYDAKGNLISVTDALNNITRFEYDSNNNRTANVDARGNRTTFAYDLAGRLTSKTMPNGGAETYVYDANGRQTAKADAKGVTIQNAYNANGRLLSKSYPDGTLTTFTYNNAGSRISASDARGTYSYDYDSRNRLTKQTYPDSQAITYGYDSTGRLHTISSLAGTIEYIYNSSGRLKEVKDPQGSVTSFTYDPAGNRTGLSYPNGTNVSYGYDANNRLNSLTHRNTATQTLSSYAYTLGSIGNRTRIDESTGISRVYEYDKLYRLTKEQVTDPANTQTFTADYSYDAVGNRLNKTTTPYSQPAVSNDYTYNSADQLVTENGVTYTYDLNGNLETKTDASGTTTYTYDYDNRLIRVAAPSGISSYIYDPDGNRVEVTNNADTTRYLVDKNRSFSQILAEYSASGNLIASYVYADDLISMTRNGQTYYYHFDGLGSTRFLTNSVGNVTDTYDYDAFGNLIRRTGTTENPFLFNGQKYDANTGFYHLRARYYQPTTGRFTAVDPYAGDIYAPASLHRYNYTANDPVNKIDPSGLFDYSLSGMLNVITTYSIMASIAFPRLTGFIIRALEVCAPVEIQVAMPNFSVASSLAPMIIMNSAKELSLMRQLYEKVGGFAGLGMAFEAWVGKLLNISKSGLRVMDGVVCKEGVCRSGYAVVDYIYKGAVLEVKLSGSAIKENQAKQLALYASKEANEGLTYIFFKKPTATQEGALRRWVAEVAPDVGVEINYLYH